MCTNLASRYCFLAAEGFSSPPPLRHVPAPTSQSSAAVPQQIRAPLGPRGLPSLQSGQLSQNNQISHTNLYPQHAQPSPPKDPRNFSLQDARPSQDLQGLARSYPSQDSEPLHDPQAMPGSLPSRSHNGAAPQQAAAESGGYRQAGAQAVVSIPVLTAYFAY